MKWIPTLMKPKAVGLPPIIAQKLVSQFRVEPDILGRMRMVEKRGQFAGRSVRWIRIFDPALITESPVVRRYDDLANLTDAIQFEGQIENGGYILLKDKRLRSQGGISQPASLMSPSQDEEPFNPASYWGGLE